MNSDLQYPKSKLEMRHFYTAFLAVFLGWGSLYVGHLSLQSNTKYSSSNNQSANVLESFQTKQQDTKPKEKERSIIVSIGGDVMFDRHIRSIGEKDGYDFMLEKVAPIFKKADLSIVNLEGPITSKKSKTLIDGKTTKTMLFTFAPETVDTLVNSGIKMVSLANNHTDNFGFDGYKETQKFLEKAGVEWFGNPWNGVTTSLRLKENDADQNSPVVTMFEKNGVKVALVGYHAFQKGLDKVISEIKMVSGSDVFTIVMPHWGEEYKTKHLDSMEKQAKMFIEAGADAVIGSHPHVIMDHEFVGDVPIFYSLGNLLFDQYFSPEVMKGNIVELYIAKKNEGVYLDHFNIYETHSEKGLGISSVDLAK
jgi:gamma-polyglutamate biosynthesis protein CapA